VTPELERELLAAAAVLRAGGLVAYPTETFYGLGARALDAAAVARLARAKGRPDGKPLPLLAADRAQVERVARLDGLAARLADRLWPGPFTLVLPARPGLPPELTAGGATVGVRVPGSELARALAAATGEALVSTSANLAGEPPVTRAGALAPDLVARLDRVLDGGETPGGAPSTLVAVEGDEVRLVRPGAVAWEAVLAAARP
jgi:L-threonylcarbamoyladenylate synthase